MDSFVVLCTGSNVDMLILFIMRKERFLTELFFSML